MATSNSEEPLDVSMLSSKEAHCTTGRMVSNCPFIMEILSNVLCCNVVFKMKSLVHMVAPHHTKQNFHLSLESATIFNSTSDLAHAALAFLPTCCTCSSTCSATPQLALLDHYISFSTLISAFQYLFDGHLC